jgi:FKBP-type peptidyl-prolyl cis-trans isomerase
MGRRNKRSRDISDGEYELTIENLYEKRRARSLKNEQEEPQRQEQAPPMSADGEDGLRDASTSTSTSTSTYNEKKAKKQKIIKSAEQDKVEAQSEKDKLEALREKKQEKKKRQKEKKAERAKQEKAEKAKQQSEQSRIEAAKEKAEAAKQKAAEKRKKKKNETKGEKGESGGGGNSGNQSFTTIRKGVQYQDILVGNGPLVQDRKKVRVAYTLRAKNRYGKVLDTSEDFGFRLGRGEVIDGWDIGVLGMKQGGKRYLIIPPQAGYGNQNIGGGPGATLFFEVTVLSC